MRQMLSGVLSAVLIALLSTTALAQTPTDATLNYAFATQLGSGIYVVNGRTAQIYRLTVPITLRSTDDHKWGIELRLPLTFGFYNFDIEDIIDKGFPDELATLALVPTVVFQRPIRENWRIHPFVGAGVGKDFSGGILNYIFAFGVDNLVIWPWRDKYHIRLGNRLVYTGYTNDDLDFTDDFSALETIVDLRRPLGFGLAGHEVDGSMFGGNYIYFISPRLFQSSFADPVELRTEWEIGFTIGTVDTWKVLGVGLPRLGLSYRFGSGADAVRVIIGNTIPITLPREKGAAID